MPAREPAAPECASNSAQERPISIPHSPPEPANFFKRHPPAIGPPCQVPPSWGNLLARTPHSGRLAQLDPINLRPFAVRALAYAPEVRSSQDLSLAIACVHGSIGSDIAGHISHNDVFVAGERHGDCGPNDFSGFAWGADRLYRPIFRPSPT